jgi:hypothetical protein
MPLNQVCRSPPDPSTRRLFTVAAPRRRPRGPPRLGATHRARPRHEGGLRRDGGRPSRGHGDIVDDIAARLEEALDLEVQEPEALPSSSERDAETALGRDAADAAGAPQTEAGKPTPVAQ